MIFFISDKFENFQQDYFIENAVVSNSKNIKLIKKIVKTFGGKIIYDGDKTLPLKTFFQKDFLKNLMDVLFCLLFLNIGFPKKSFILFSIIFILFWIITQIINPFKKYLKYKIELTI